MTRCIDICFASESECFRAELIEDAAPQTCEVVWRALPIESMEAKHPIFSGLAITMPVPLDFDVIEHPTVLSQIGDVLFHANPNRTWMP